MLVKTIEFENYLTGEMVKDDFYFHLNQAEVVEWLTTSGDYTLDKVLLKLVRERNGKQIMDIIKDFIRKSYGEPSLDGRRFVKSEELTDAFIQTEAYSKLFMELVSDGEKAAAFISGVMPKEMSDDIQKAIAENPDGIPKELRDYLPKDHQKKQS